MYNVARTDGFSKLTGPTWLFSLVPSPSPTSYFSNIFLAKAYFPCGFEFD